MSSLEFEITGVDCFSIPFSEEVVVQEHKQKDMKTAFRHMEKSNGPVQVVISLI